MKLQVPAQVFALCASLAVMAGCGGGASGTTSLPAASSTAPLGPVVPAQTEVTYYNGKLTNWVIPGVDTAHQQFLGCFPAGPAVTSPFPTGVLYAITVPGATMHVCPNNSDPTQTHDHLMSAMPGIPVNPSVWQVWGVVPGPAFTASILPVKTVDALNTAVSNGQLTILPWDGSTIDGIIQ